MKKLTISVSPFLMLIIPVLFAVLLSLSFKSNNVQIDSELTTTTTTKITTQKLVKAGEISIIRFLLAR